MCRNLPSTATYRAATYLEPQLTVPEISVPQFAYCRNLPPAATYRLPQLTGCRNFPCRNLPLPQLSGHHGEHITVFSPCSTHALKGKDDLSVLQFNSDRTVGALGLSITHLLYL